MLPFSNYWGKILSSLDKLFRRRADISWLLNFYTFFDESDETIVFCVDFPFTVKKMNSHVHLLFEFISSIDKINEVRQ